MAMLSTTAMATEPNLDGTVTGGTPPSHLVLQSFPYPNCDPMGIDLDPATGLIWLGDQGGTTSQGECPPAGQIYTFDPATSLWNLEFVISDIIGFVDVAANGVEVVGDYLYIADFNGDVTNFDDSIYKFTKTGTFVAQYDISYALDQVVGIGYLQGVFYVTTTAGEVFGFVENESAGTMDLVFSTTIAATTAGGGGLDWDPVCGVWLHTDFRIVPPTIIVMDAGFNIVGEYDAEITNPIGITIGAPFVGLPTWYVISRDDILVYKTNDHPPCATTPVGATTWGNIKSLYR
jgi:hypothetical protein